MKQQQTLIRWLSLLLVLLLAGSHAKADFLYESYLDDDLCHVKFIMPYQLATRIAGSESNEQLNEFAKALVGYNTLSKDIIARSDAYIALKPKFGSADASSVFSRISATFEIKKDYSDPNWHKIATYSSEQPWNVANTKIENEDWMNDDLGVIFHYRESENNPAETIEPTIHLYPTPNMWKNIAQIGDEQEEERSDGFTMRITISAYIWMMEDFPVTIEYERHYTLKYTERNPVKIDTKKQGEITFSDFGPECTTWEQNFAHYKYAHGESNIEYDPIIDKIDAREGSYTLSDDLVLHYPEDGQPYTNYRFEEKGGYWLLTKGLFLFPTPGSTSMDVPASCDHSYLHQVATSQIGFDQDKLTNTLSWKHDGRSVRDDCHFFIYRLTRDGNTPAVVDRNTRAKWVYVGKVAATGDEEKVHKFQDSDNLKYNTQYVYAIVTIPNVWLTAKDSKLQPEKNCEQLPLYCPCKLTEVDTTPNVSYSTQLTQDSDKKENITLKWLCTKIPNGGSTITFNVYRRVASEDSWTRLGTADVRNNGTTYGAYTDTHDLKSCTEYEYQVSTEISNTALGLKNKWESNVLTATLLERSYITEINTTKGEHQNSVIVSWSAKLVGDADVTYNVERRLANGSADDNYATIYTVTGRASSYMYEDKNAESGQYYMYRVSAYTPSCDGASDDLVLSNTVENIGFGLNRGSISGNITYGSAGAAVEGVRLVLSTRSGEEGNALERFAQQITGPSEGIYWNATQKKTAELINSAHPFTIQLLVRPTGDCDKAPIVSIPGMGDLTVNADNDNYQLALCGQTFGVSIPELRYTHITLRVRKGSADLILDGKTDQVYTVAYSDKEWSAESPLSNSNTNNLSVGGKSQLPEQNAFIGYLREFRLWSKELTNREIGQTYDRVLSGREQDIAIYWPMDEGTQGYVFDFSNKSGVSNQRHATVGANVLVVNNPELLPDSTQVQIYGLTDTKGQFTVRGIPFNGTGLTYTVTPQLDKHVFSPASRNGFISSKSLILNNYDFTDRSSFEYSGVVTYLDTDIPVDSVTFSIDGIPVMRDGKSVVSDRKGKFTIDVPIGEHYIEAQASGHTVTRFPESGTYCFTEGGVLNLADSTLVNVAGRINGGVSDATAQLGFGLSTNRIGPATVTLKLETQANNRFNMSGVKGQHKVIESMDNRISSNNYYPDQATTDIVIETDPKTGEFSAMLPPLRYVIKSITFGPGSPYNEADCFTKQLPSVDARFSPTQCVDTLMVDGEQKEYPSQSRTIINYRSEPEIDVHQVYDSREYCYDAFGEDSIVVNNKTYHMFSLYTKQDEKENAKHQENHLKKYNYLDYPVFVEGEKYDMVIAVYENYDYYDAQGNFVKAYCEVPTDGKVLVNNQMSNLNRLLPDQYAQGNVESKNALIQTKVGPNGILHYKFTCGKPNFATEDHTKTITFSFSADNKLTLWQGTQPNPDGKGILRAIVLGQQITGTNFVTKGPDYPLYVLRDPGGAGSSASLSESTIHVDYSGFTTNIARKVEGGTEWKTGTKINFTPGVVFANTGKGVTIEQDYQYVKKTSVSTSLSWIYDESETLTVSSTEKYTTGNDFWHVGRQGDTYIGYSTNLYYGLGKKLTLKEDNQRLKLAEEEDLITDLTVMDSTHYMFSEYDIVNRTIPSWKQIRNLKLEHVDSWSAVPTRVTDGRQHYYTTLQPDDPRFGSNNDDERYWSQAEMQQNNGRPSYVTVADENLANLLDTVSLLNTYIINWENCIAANEDDKIDAIEHLTPQNFTFSGGNTITQTHTSSNSEITAGTSDYRRTIAITSLGIKGKGTTLISKQKCVIDFAYATDRTKTWSGNQRTETKNQVSYTLAHKNKSAGLSISVYDSPRKWGPIFITEGGQTATPWEDATYCEYSIDNRGKQLDQRTLKIENADLNVVNPVVNDIPNGDLAYFKLELTGMSEVQSPELFTLKLDPESDLKRGVLKIDGSPLTATGLTWKLFQTTVAKTMTLEQTDLSVLDYKFRIRLESTSDPWHIYTQWFDMEAHFIPTSCPATLEVDTKVVNTGREGVKVTLSDINTNFEGLMGVELLRRRVGSTDWSTEKVWMLKDYQQQDPTADLLPESGKVQHLLTFDSDGIYELYGRTFAQYGTERVYRQTDTIQVVQDRQAPRQLGSIEPTSGTLTLTGRNSMCITFDEDINVNAISQQKNFILRYEDDNLIEPVRIEEALYDYTASDRQITFSFKDALLPKMSGHNLLVSVQQIPDLYGNESDTISWQVKCDFRTITWYNQSLEINLSLDDESRTQKIHLAPIVNNHNYSIEAFILSDDWIKEECPKWLKLSNTNGTTRVNNDDTYMTLKVSQAAPIGTHYLWLVVTDDNGVKDGMNVIINIEGHVPDWQVNPADYEDNMTLVAELWDDNNEPIYRQNSLAAFDQEGRCCGVAQGIEGKAYIVIYGNADEQKQIHFEYYNRQSGLTHSYLNFKYPNKQESQQSIPFVAGSMIGNASSPAQLTIGNGYVQHIKLSKGWNWISLYLQPTQGAVKELLAPYADKLELIKDQSSFADVTEQGNEDRSSWINGEMATATLQPGRLYKIKAREDVCFDVYSEQLVSKPDLQLVKGWNWMGCAGPQPMALDDLLPNAQMADFIKSNRYYAYRNERGEWEGTLEAVLPSIGYCYYANAEAPKAYAYMPAQAQRRAPEVEIAQYSDNMTIVARLLDGTRYLSNAEVEVIVNGSTRAYAVTDATGLCYLTVMGNDIDLEQPLTLRIDGSNEISPEGLIFMTDEIRGTTLLPYLINLQPDGLSRLPQDDEASTFTYDLLGRRIEEPDNQKGFYFQRNKKSMINE